MRYKVKKGFTLIEIMIVLSIIAILSVILIPKVGIIKLEAKNNSVSTNVSLVRSYLQNRAGRDGVSYQAYINATPPQTPEQALNAIKNSIGSDMISKFSYSNAVTNPFNNSSSIIYAQASVSSNSSSSASVILGYDSVNTLPGNNDQVIENSRSGVSFVGDIVVTVYKTGYVLYGVDNSGKIISNSIYIISFPPIPSSVQSAIIPGSGGSNILDSINGNIASVVNYIKSIAITSIITGAPNGQMWNVIQGPLYNNLYNKFTPGDSSKHIVNPYFINVDEIGNQNNWINPNKTYSIISNPNPSDYSSIDNYYSTRHGTVIVYVTNNPIGYVVYGVDTNGNNVGKTDINLSTEITSQMTQKLADNVNSVYNILINYIGYNISKSTYGNVQNMADLAYSQLQTLNINNAYIPSWNEKQETTSGNFSPGYALIVGGNDVGASYSDYKGSVIVDTLSDGSGYEVYGIDYNGINYNKKIISVNSVVSSNVNSIVEYLNSFTASNSNGDNKYDAATLEGLIATQFNNSIVNPYNSSWNAIVLATNDNLNTQSSVIVCDNHTNLNYQNYKGDVIVQKIDGSGFTYRVFGIGYDGNPMSSTTVSFKK
ncbi:MAG: type II secretion system protein [Clostridium sp.]|uniref:type II secretion system protein n=1 Tax=Clostridium sp. TaxID=1506 RepID=UPI0039ED333F